MTPDNLAFLIEAARELRLTPVLPVPLEALGDLELLRQWQPNVTSKPLHYAPGTGWRHRDVYCSTR